MEGLDAHADPIEALFEDGAFGVAGLRLGGLSNQEGSGGLGSGEGGGDGGVAHFVRVIVLELGGVGLEKIEAELDVGGPLARRRESSGGLSAGSGGVGGGDHLQEQQHGKDEFGHVFACKELMEEEFVIEGLWLGYSKVERNVVLQFIIT